LKSCRARGLDLDSDEARDVVVGVLAEQQGVVCGADRFDLIRLQLGWASLRRRIRRP
jgi:hypothetical protein